VAHPLGWAGVVWPSNVSRERMAADVLWDRLRTRPVGERPRVILVLGGGGAGMLKDKKQTLSTLKKISEAIKTPFSIKTRAGLTVEDKKSQFDFILEAAEFIPMITVHGRTYKQSHSGDVDRDFIYQIKKNL
jgi:tRNA-dihydrouridine synthase